MHLSYRLTAVVIALVTLSAIAPIAHARPDYCERGDTMDLPPGAQEVIGNGPLERLNGNIEGPGIRGGDVGDMYLVNITDPGSFMLRLVAGGGVRPQLWLFAGPGLASYREGVGLLGNNGVGLPYEGALLLNASTDGTGIVLTEPGFYYIAVTGQAPADSGGAGRVPQGRSPAFIADIFDFGPGFEISGPDGMAGEFPIFRWRDDGDDGIYSIEAEGVTLIPNSCASDLNGNGSIGFGDILLLLANWGPCDAPPICVLEEGFDGFVAGEPLIPQQPCFPKCPVEFSWQAFDDDPFGGDAIVAVDPDPDQDDNALRISGSDDIIHTFNGLDEGLFLLETEIYVPAFGFPDAEFSLLNGYFPQQGSNFSLRLVTDAKSGLIRDIDSNASLPLVVDAWVDLSVLIDLENDAQTVFYNDEVLVVKSWTEGATGEGELDIAGLRLQTFFDGAGDANPGDPAAYFDSVSFCRIFVPSACEGDLDFDEVVGFSDLLLVLREWGECE